MNLAPSHALLADPEEVRRARIRRELLQELPGVEVVEAGDPDAVIWTLERRPVDLAIVSHPMPPDPALPLLLKKRWPEHVLLLYAPVEGEHALAEALATAGDAYFLDAGTALPGLRAGLRLALARTRAATRLAVIVLYDIVASAVTVALQILGPEERIRPGFVWVPLAIRDAYGTASLASIITMTPGTLSVDLSRDRRHLLVHALHVDDPAELIVSIKSRYEEPLMAIFEGEQR